MTARRVPWVALAAAGGCIAFWVGNRLLGLGLLHFPPCPFKALTGLPCATCGLTRWALALGAGDLKAAFHWHPVASLSVMALPAVALWDLHRARRNDPYPDLPQSGWARAAAAGLLLGTWALQAVRGI